MSMSGHVVSAVLQDIDAASRLLKAMGNPHRLQVLCHLTRGEKSVGELERLLGTMSQSALSQHLARLRHAGLVQTRRDAQTIYYSIQSQDAKIVLVALASINRAHARQKGKAA